MYKRITLLLCITFVNTILCSSVYIIIHGTWASSAQWYMPGGDFFDTLEQSIQNKEHDSATVPFCWDGSNSIEIRNQAAQNLAKLIDSYDQKTNIILIGHSHGGTVALLASNLLKKNKIALLYTLGTPILNTIYPNMDKIKYCYNLFSFEDLVQPVLGMFKREHRPHERIGNIRILINDKEPDHSELHDPLVGHWLPLLHEYIMSTGKKISEPGIIYFKKSTIPLYVTDPKRQELLERDNQLSQLILNSFRHSLEIESKIPLTNR